MDGIKTNYHLRSCRSMDMLKTYNSNMDKKYEETAKKIYEKGFPNFEHLVFLSYNMYKNRFK